MNKIFLYFILPFALSGCGISYHYYAPLVNNNSFANKNETHISAQAGITGSAVKFGYALTENAAITGVFQNSSPLKYHGSEFEPGVMIGKNDSLIKGNKKNITLGCGLGSNYEKTPEAAIKNFRGNFVKPFAMLTFGSANNAGPRGNFIYADHAFSLKVNYLMYNGYKATTDNNIPIEKKFNTGVFFAEPYYNFNLGGKWFRIDLGLGAIMKKKYEFDKNIAIFPFEANAGILLILGRNSPFSAAQENAQK